MHNDVEVSVPPGGHPRVVSVLATGDGSIPVYVTFTEKAFRKLVSEGEAVISYWEAPVPRWHDSP